MSGGELSFSTERYSLEFADDRPFVYLYDADGHRLGELFVPSSVHSSRGLDDTTSMGAWAVEETETERIYTLEATSSTWERKRYSFHCRPGGFSYGIEVAGEGLLTDVHYFGGFTSACPRWGSGFFHSGHSFDEGFNPEPNVEDATSFSPRGGSVIDLVGAPLPGKRHWFFNPAPFCFAFRSEKTWLGIGVSTEAGQYRFTEYRYHGQDGFYLSLLYEGHTRVSGSYCLPSITFDFSDDPYTALAIGIAGLPRSQPATRASWWAEPIFCGWGAQCDLAAREHGYAVRAGDEPDALAFVATLRHASEYARQDVYEAFLKVLADRDVHPGTVVLDDKWQLSYGGNEVDRTKWPDLPGFIAERHARGQHVLLWLKAWDRDGIPDDECITNAAGVPLTVDPTHPSYERRLRASVRRMLDGYGGDGFKIDFTHRIPSGPGIRTHGDLWGLELMRHYLGIIHDEAKHVKPDALVMTHTPHPYLADVVDMIRLNDMLDLTHLTHPETGRNIARTLAHRARVAALACPHALIDTDNWPVRDKTVWREYVRLQPEFGVPSLYFVTEVDLTQEPLEEEDYALVRDAWTTWQERFASHQL